MTRHFSENCFFWILTQKASKQGSHVQSVQRYMVCYISSGLIYPVLKGPFLTPENMPKALGKALKMGLSKGSLDPRRRYLLAHEMRFQLIRELTPLSRS